MEMNQDIKPTTLKLMRAWREFHKSSWQEQAIAGCKPSEIRVLFCIKHGTKSGSSTMKVSEISKLLRVTSPTVTQMLKGLEGNGLIERHVDPLDRRFVDIKLSEKGETFTRQAVEAFTALWMDWLNTWERNKAINLPSFYRRRFATLANEKFATLTRVKPLPLNPNGMEMKKDD